jgi:hypothetical protein
MHLSEPSDGDGKTYRFQHSKSEFALHGKNKLPRKLKRKEERHMKRSHYTKERFLYSISDNRKEIQQIKRPITKLWPHCC